MTKEVHPAFVYSVETDVLEVDITDDAPLNDEAQSRRDTLLKPLDYELVVVDGREKIQVGVASSLGEARKDKMHESTPAIESMIMLQSWAFYQTVEDPVVKMLGGFGVYPALQVYLNETGIPEEAREEAVSAMHSVMDYDRSMQWFRVGPQQITMEILRYGDDRSEKAYAEWFGLAMETAGSCACWGVNNGGDTYFTDSQEVPVYTSGPHNVDFARQELSGILAVGTLARRAAEYTPKADLLAGLEFTS